MKFVTNKSIVYQFSSESDDISIHFDAPFLVTISAVCGIDGTTEKINA